MKRKFWNAAAGAVAERAVIDIGSNTVRLVIFGGPPRAPVELLNEKVTARLGRGLADNGKLSAKAWQAALKALARHAALLQLRGVRSVATVATAATRDAANGAEFLASVADLGLAPRQLSGEEEAITSALGVIAAFPGSRGVVADLGGGSLELVDIAAGQSRHGTSLPLGTLRLPALRDGGPTRFAQRIHRVLEGGDWSGRRGQPLYLVGGSFRAIARFAMHRLSWPLDDPHGFVLPPQEALRLCRAAVRAKAPVTVPGLSASRLAALPDAAALLAALVAELSPSALIFSAWGLREGVLHASLAEADARADPLLAGVAAFAQSFGVDQARAALVSDWIGAADLIGTVQGGSLAADADRLRQAAALLALAVQRVEPNLRAETARDWALRKRWIGIDAPGRAMLAAALAGNAARPFEVADTRLAPPEALQAAWVWGLGIRLCRRFSDADPRVLKGSSLRQEAGQLVLDVAEPWHALCTDLVLKDLRALAAALGAEPDLRLG